MNAVIEFTRKICSVHASLLPYRRYSGIGIVFPNVDLAVHRDLYRHFTKKGRVVFFEADVSTLEKYRRHVLFLAEEGDGVPLHESLGIGVGILYFEARTPRLKRWLRPGEIYSGRLCRGKICRDINGVVYVPTRSYESHLFLCHPSDLRRPVDGKITHPLEDLVFAYRYYQPRNYVGAVMIPVFPVG